MPTKSDQLFGKGNYSSSDVLRLYILAELEKITVSSSSSGLATEATLISVLNAIIASDQDVEVLLVRDTITGIVYKQVTDWTTGVPTVYYTDVNGAPFVPITTITYLDPSAVLNLILSELQLLNTVDYATETTQAANNVLLGTIDADTSVLATPSTGLPISMSRITVAGAGSIPSGKRKVSIFNAGNSNSTVSGATLKSGEFVSFSADGLRDTLASITYDCLTSELLITTVG